MRRFPPAPALVSVALLAATLLVASCGLELRYGLTSGPWRAWLDSPGGELPFGLEFEHRDDVWRAWLLNGSERIEAERVEVAGDRVVLGIDHYDSEIEAKVSEDGSGLEGRWRRTSSGGTVSELAFHARQGERPRFTPDPDDESASPAPGVGGRWAVDFETEDDLAVAEFVQHDDGTVTGTFLTTKGDYRYLAGRADSNGRLRLSVFDGAHAFLFDAQAQEDGTLAGDFWSRDSWHETWTAWRDDEARLDSPTEQVAWVGGRGLSELVYPDTEGNPRALDDDAFAGKARIIEIFGSWCPNCNDATRYLVELDRRYRERGLAILGLAFEMTGDFERDARQVRVYRDYHGIEYPLLIAGLSDKDEASKAFPLIERVKSYPTTIFLDAEGRVRAVYSGFSGPATGPAHEALRAEFEALIEELLAGAG